MPKSQFIHRVVAIALVVALLPAMASAITYEVTVTNLSLNQILSPPVVASHSSDYRIFTPGQPSSSELAALAEDADVEPLLALLGAEDQVGDAVVAGGAVMPGQSVTIEVEGGAGARTFTVLGMLVTTNDAFFSTRGSFPKRGALAKEAVAYDAGSERNTQSCAHIPGPPCGNGGVRVTEGAEGYVYVHSGIHRFGSLRPRLFDWRNPVARIVVRKAN